MLFNTLGHVVVLWWPFQNCSYVWYINCSRTKLLFSPGLSCCSSLACSKQEVLLEQDLVLTRTRCNFLIRESASLALQEWGELVLPRLGEGGTVKNCAPFLPPSVLVGSWLGTVGSVLSFLQACASWDILVSCSSPAAFVLWRPQMQLVQHPVHPSFP